MAEKKVTISFIDQFNKLKDKPKPKKNEAKGPVDLKDLRAHMSDKQSKRFRRP